MGVRELQGLSRIPETLTVAMEFITMPTLPEQLPAVEELRKQTLRYGYLPWTWHNRTLCRPASFCGFWWPPAALFGPPTHPSACAPT